MGGRRFTPAERAQKTVDALDAQIEAHRARYDEKTAALADKHQVEAEALAEKYGPALNALITERNHAAQHPALVDSYVEAVTEAMA